MPLQKVNLGTAPAGIDGDTVRVANVKANANVDVLNTQATLTSSSPNAVRDLTAADMGQRVNFTPTAASTVHFPGASTTGADQIVAVHNLSAAYDITMAIAAGSGDTAPTVYVVKPGEMLTYETDGVSVWRTIGRKKSLDEVVQGKLSVAGAFFVGTSASISAVGAYSGASAAYTGNVSVGGTLGVTGASTFAAAATFSGTATFSGAATFATAAFSSATFGTNSVVTISAAGAYSGVGATYTGAVTVGGNLAVNGSGGISAGTLTTSGALALVSSANVITLSANGAERGRFDTAGGFHVNETAAWSSGQISTRSSSGNPWGISSYAAYQANGGCYLSRIESTATPYHAFFFGAAAVGTITCANGTSTAYNTTSDYRLKQNYSAIEHASETLLRIAFYEGEFKANPGHTEHYVLAHELQQVIPHAVVGEKDGVDDEGTIVLQVVDYSKLVPLLGAALQNALRRIAALEAGVGQ